MNPGDPSWQNPLASAYGHHDFADFAQEFLRRNSAYRQAILFDLKRTSPSDTRAQDSLLHAWGLCHPVHPDASPRNNPALWRPEIHPAVLEIRWADEDFRMLLPPGYVRLAEHKTLDAHHLVLGHAQTRLRMSIRYAAGQQTPLVVLPHDDRLAVRIGTAAFFAAAFSQRRSPPRQPFQPSIYQRVALVRLLQISDALAQGATCRDIARDIVFPHHEHLAGAEWKGSSLKRHCWRLIAQTRRLEQGGHVRLLELARGSR